MARSLPNMNKMLRLIHSTRKKEHGSGPASFTLQSPVVLMETDIPAWAWKQIFRKGLKAASDGHMSQGRNMLCCKPGRFSNYFT